MFIVFFYKGFCDKSVGEAVEDNWGGATLVKTAGDVNGGCVIVEVEGGLAVQEFPVNPFSEHRGNTFTSQVVDEYV